jgi:hypothetical protein
MKKYIYSFIAVTLISLTSLAFAQKRTTGDSPNVIRGANSDNPNGTVFGPAYEQIMDQPQLFGADSPTLGVPEKEVKYIKKSDLIKLCKRRSAPSYNDYENAVISIVMHNASDFPLGRRGCCGQENWNISIPNIDQKTITEIVKQSRKNLIAAERLIDRSIMNDYIDTETPNIKTESIGDLPAEAVIKDGNLVIQTEFKVQVLQNSDSTDSVPGAHFIKYSDPITVLPMALIETNEESENLNLRPTEDLVQIPKSFSCARRLELHGFRYLND